MVAMRSFYSLCFSVFMLNTDNYETFKGVLRTLLSMYDQVFFQKIVNGSKSLAIITRSSILDVWQDP